MIRTDVGAGYWLAWEHLCLRGEQCGVESSGRNAWRRRGMAEPRRRSPEKSLSLGIGLRGRSGLRRNTVQRTCLVRIILMTRSKGLHRRITPRPTPRPRSVLQDVVLALGIPWGKALPSTSNVVCLLR